jgi:hypothetical protein
LPSRLLFPHQRRSELKFRFRIWRGYSRAAGEEAAAVLDRLPIVILAQRFWKHLPQAGEV